MEKTKKVQTDVIHFFTGKNQVIIGKNKTGKVVLSKGSRIKAGEDWEIEIIKENKNCIIALPLFKVKTVEENNKSFANSVQNLINKYKED